jgi:YOP proteins translocation protein K (YscK)
MVAARDERSVLELWDELMTRPSCYINELRLSACLEGNLSAEACRKLKTSSRGQSRLSDVISARYLLTGWVDPEQCNEADRVIALSSGQRLTEIAMRAGAIFWSAEIVRVVASKHVASLHRQLGESVCASAIANRDLAGPVGRLKLVRDLVALVKEDGWRCLNAWCQAQPSGVSRRVRLKLPPAEAFDRAPRSPFVEAGPAIVRRAAG